MEATGRWSTEEGSETTGERKASEDPKLTSNPRIETNDVPCQVNENRTTCDGTQGHGLLAVMQFGNLVVALVSQAADAHVSFLWRGGG